MLKFHTETRRRDSTVKMANWRPVLLMSYEDITRQKEFFCIVLIYFVNVLKIHGVNIHHVQQLKILDITIDSNINWIYTYKLLNIKTRHLSSQLT